MKRGIVILAAPELELLQTWLETTDLPPLVKYRLKPLTADQPAAQIEISQEDGETLLDSLPIPQVTESPTLTKLRIKLQQFLQTL